MCLIAIGTVSQIKKLKLKDAWDSNPDGAGIAIPDAHDPTVIKGIMTLTHLHRALNSLPQNKRISLHLRMATHGGISIANTHPFRLDDRTFYMHNGILSGLGYKSQSDTAHLAKILAKLNHHDRMSLLKALPGKYAVVRDKTIHTFGDFTEELGVLLSNTYWRFTYHTTHKTTSSFPKWDFYGRDKDENNYPKHLSD